MRIPFRRKRNWQAEFDALLREHQKHAEALDALSRRHLETLFAAFSSKP